jgi:hypothetical protein
MKRTALALLWVSLAACTPKLIPGTEIQDTPDTRALLLLMEQFRSALENKDVKALVSLTAPSFHDESGTPSPDDDLDASNLSTKLTQRLGRFKDVRVDMDIRKIDVDERENRAQVIYYYTVSFRAPTPGAHGERDSDLKQMSLVRDGANKPWRIASGI